MKWSLYLAAAAALCTSALAQKGETVKIAWVEPLSGLMAPVGLNSLKTFQFTADIFSGANNPAGVRFEVVPFDSKLGPTETLNALRSAADQGIRYIVLGGGSAAALAMVDAVEKYNARTSMKMEALTTFMKDEKDIKKVYLVNQNYSHGHQVSKLAKEDLARKRPDVQIVGDDLHPLAQALDFAPYIAKIKASSADTVITGNWGSDLALLVKAANEAGYTGKFYTYYAGMTDTPAALGQTGAGRVFQIASGH